MEHPRLPFRAVLTGGAPSLDDPEQPVADRGVDAPRHQPLIGQREQPAQDEFGGRHIAESRLEQVRVNAAPRAGLEVVERRRERQL